MPICTMSLSPQAVTALIQENMADAQENLEEEKPKKTGMGTPTLIGIIAGVVILQVIIVFVIFKVFVSPGGSTKSEKSTTEHRTDDEGNGEESLLKVREVREIVATEDMILNPRGSSSRYVLLALGLEVDSPEVGKEVEERLMIPIQHTTRSFVGRFSVEELERQTLVDSLPNRLRMQLQPYFGEYKLRHVYFKKFIIQ